MWGVLSRGGWWAGGPGQCTHSPRGGGGDVVEQVLPVLGPGWAGRVGRGVGVWVANTEHEAGLGPQPER